MKFKLLTYLKGAVKSRPLWNEDFMYKNYEPVYSGTCAEIAFEFFKEKILMTAPDRKQGCFHVTIADADETVPPLLSGHWNEQDQEFFMSLPVEGKKQAVEMQFYKFFARDAVTVDYNITGYPSEDEVNDTLAKIETIKNGVDENKFVLTFT